ncbi:MAG TPA: hypothetical protein VFF45_00640 [Bacilli bacterium]|nr:hypothetical protein [Bacilli bacterium]
MTPQSAIQRALELIASRGSAPLAEAGLGAEEALAIARERPEIEPVFLARFRSRQGRTRVEEVRAYAWPSQQIAMRHLGYRVEEARLVRLEPRRPVPFPARLYAAFAGAPEQLEALRLAEKAFERAIQQAASKPGRAERDLLAVQPAFRRLGEEVALEMWIEAAGIFQRLDNPTYAGKMLGNLLRVVQADRKVDPSRLARTVLAAADDGVFNARLYEFTWDLVAKRISVEAALGFGLRVFRRLLTSGRPLPEGFVRDLHRAALKGEVAGFEALFDGTVVWAAGLPSFWNTSRKTSAWREERTQDHPETGLLRRRLVDLWARARSEPGGEGWKAEVWGRIRAALPEIGAYGRAVLVESLLAVLAVDDERQRPGPGAPGREDAGRLLEATLAMLSRPPRGADRVRVERAGDAALAKVRAVAEDLLWERVGLIDEALRAAAGDLASFVALADLLSDLGDELAPREGKTLLGALPGLEAAWEAALTAALLGTEGPQDAATDAGSKDDDEDDEDDDDEDDEDEDNSGREAEQLPIVPLLGEVISLLRPESAPEHLAALGPLIASRLSWDLVRGSGLEAWAPVLAALRALGPVGAGVASDATARFVARAGGSENFKNGARLAHLLDPHLLREAAESRRVTDEALRRLRDDVTIPATSLPLLRPLRELGQAHSLVDVVALGGGTYSLLWAKDPKDEYAEDRYREVAITLVSEGGAVQCVVASGNLKGASLAAQWATPEGPRVVAIKDRTVQLLDAAFKPVARLVLPDEFEENAYDREVIAGRRFALIHQDQVALLVDPALKPAGFYEASGWGSWSFLDVPDARAPDGQAPAGDAAGGHEAVVLATTYNNIRKIFLAPGREAPPVRVRDYGAPVLAARTDDGGFFIDHTTTRQGERRRIRLGERGWERAPLEPPARPVLDAFAPSDQAWVRLVGGETVGYVETAEPRAIHDFAGEKLAVIAEGPGECEILEVRTGFAIFKEGIVVDPSLPARIGAAPHLRAAMRPKDAPGSPLPRSLHGDRAGVAAHVRAELAQREAGRAALEALGEHAGAVLDAAAGALLPVLEARAAVLEALDAPAPAVPSVPRHVPGVRRVEVRRAAGAGFSAPLDGLVFWALDGDDPRPVLDYLAPAGGPVHAVHPGAWSAAVRLLGVAQLVRTSRALAERALRLAESIASTLEAPGAFFQMEGAEPDLDDDDEELDDEGEAHAVPVRALPVGEEAGSLLWEPRGRYARREMPVRWEADLGARSAALQGWIARSLLGPLAPRSLEPLRERPTGVAHYRAEVALGESIFHIHVAVRVREDGLDWRIVDVSGRGPLGAWHALFERLEEAIAQSGSVAATRGLVWTGGGAPRREDLEALRRGIALTHAHLDDRGSLRPDAWPAPEIRGVEDPRHRRYVLLAWLLGELDVASVGSTRAIFEKLARATPLVEATSDTLRPQRHRGKALEISPELARARLTAVARAPLGALVAERSLDAIVVLRDPAEIADAFAREAGLLPARSAARRGGRAL